MSNVLDKYKDKNPLSAYRNASAMRQYVGKIDMETGRSMAVDSSAYTPKTKEQLKGHKAAFFNPIAKPILKAGRKTRRRKGKKSRKTHKRR